MMIVKDSSLSPEYKNKKGIYFKLILAWCKLKVYYLGGAGDANCAFCRYNSQPLNSSLRIDS